MIKNIIIIMLFIMFVFSPIQAFAYEYTHVRAEHILVATEQEAKNIQIRILNGEDFEELAQQYSLCPSKLRGGDLGYFNKGQMVKEFEDAAFSMAIGEVSEPVQTQYGWHIIKLLDRK